MWMGRITRLLKLKSVWYRFLSPQEMSGNSSSLGAWLTEFVSLLGVLESPGCLPPDFKCWPALVTRAAPEVSTPSYVIFSLSLLSAVLLAVHYSTNARAVPWFKTGLCEPEVQPGPKILCFSGELRAGVGGGEAMQASRPN